MQVVYEKSITDKVLDARREAIKTGRKISHIVIDKSEWLEICEESKKILSEVVPNWTTIKWLTTRPGDGLGLFCGIRIRKGDES